MTFEIEIVQTGIILTFTFSYCSVMEKDLKHNIK